MNPHPYLLELQVTPRVRLYVCACMFVHVLNNSSISFIWVDLCVTVCSGSLS